MWICAPQPFKQKVGPEGGINTSVTLEKSVSPEWYVLTINGIYSQVSTLILMYMGTLVMVLNSRKGHFVL